MEASDQILLARIAGGDRSAFALFYDRYSSRVYGLVLKLTRASREADDVLQDTFWHVWTRASQFDANRGTPLAWLILIARSRALDMLRRAQRTAFAAGELAEEACPCEDTLAGDLHQSEAGERARRLLTSLPDEQRTALQLAFYDGLSHQQIAQRLGIALGTIKTRIRLGMTKLREALSDLDPATLTS